MPALGPRDFVDPRLQSLVLAVVRGTRTLWHETDTWREGGNGTPVKNLDGGLIKAGIVVSEPASGRYLNQDGQLDDAYFAVCLIVAEPPTPVRFGDIYQWENRRFEGTFRAHPRGVCSPCPLSVWAEFVRRYQTIYI